jgi:hypothetical protein
LNKNYQAVFNIAKNIFGGKILALTNVRNSSGVGGATRATRVQFDGSQTQLGSGGLSARARERASKKSNKIKMSPSLTWRNGGWVDDQSSAAVRALAV